MYICIFQFKFLFYLNLTRMCIRENCKRHVYTVPYTKLIACVYTYIYARKYL